MAFAEFLDNSEDYSLDQFFVILSDDDNSNDNLQEQQLPLPDFMREDRCFTCRQCKITFNSKFEKKLHSELHRMTYSCLYCANYTGTPEKSDLVEHLKVEHADIGFLFCEDCLFFCEKYQKKAYQNHRKSHNSRNLHACPYPDCGHTTRRRYDLKRHVERIHEPNKEQAHDNKYYRITQPRKKRKINSEI